MQTTSFCFSSFDLGYELSGKTRPTQQSIKQTSKSSQLTTTASDAVELTLAERTKMSWADRKQMYLEQFDCKSSISKDAVGPFIILKHYAKAGNLLPASCF